jgi:predicted aconitase/predicted aconitase with swiveling domain
MAVGASYGQVLSGTAYVNGPAMGEVLACDLELSFWGGVDPSTGEIIDRHHPLSGQCLENRILAIPGGRGSCSGSGVMLELLLNGKGPKAMLFEREEDILTLGVVVAEEIFGQSIPVVTLGPANFRTVLNSEFVRIDGSHVSCGTSEATPEPDWILQTEPTDPFCDVELSDIDRAFLSGGHGAAAQAAIRIILRMAKLQGAQQLMDVTQVHVDGCIYTGPGSLAFAEKLRDLGGQVLVPTTLNSISVDHKRWRSQGIDATFGEPAARLGDVYTQMGALPTFTCAPYLLDTAPKVGEQVAWAESNAVVYANSVLGARTMKYPDFLDICIALTGRAPLAGPHVDVNRKAALQVNVSDIAGITDDFYPLLGYHVGALAGNRIPVITGLEHAAPTPDDLKAFGAAFATVSSAPMFHIRGVTPEAKTLADVMPETDHIPSIDLMSHQLASSWEELNSADGGPVDLVSFGNPHFSVSELRKLAAMCVGREKHPKVAIIVTCGRATHAKAKDLGLIAALESFGVQFVTDTCWCMIVDPLIPPAASTIMTNSGKYAHYGPGLTNRKFYFGSMMECIAAACEGRHKRILPAWMQAGHG